MASSGGWENFILSKTPTFDGICGMLSLQHNLDTFAKFKIFLFNQFLLLTDGKPTCLLWF